MAGSSPRWGLLCAVLLLGVILVQTLKDTLMPHSQSQRPVLPRAPASPVVSQTRSTTVAGAIAKPGAGGAATGKPAHGHGTIATSPTTRAATPLPTAPSAASGLLDKVRGTWRDGGNGGDAGIRVDGEEVLAVRSCCEPQVGFVENGKLLLFGLEGKLVEATPLRLSWSNGIEWVKISNVEPKKPTPVPGVATLPPLPPKCPGKDKRVYISKTTNPFYLCTHGVSDMVSSAFIGSGWWMDCQAIPQILRNIRDITNATKLEAVDVGGNIGTCSWVMAAEGAHVNTFEPAPVNLRVFEKSIELNRPRYGDAITLHHKGAGSEAATAKIKSESGNFGNSVVEKHGKDLGNLFDGRQSHWAEEETIHITRLDDEVKHHVHFMKMDCQGHEIEALLGARTLMMEHGVDVIRTEFDQQFLKKSGHAPVRLLRLFDEYGYVVLVNGAPLLATHFDEFASIPRQTEIFALNKRTIDDKEWHRFQ